MSQYMKEEANQASCALAVGGAFDQLQIWTDSVAVNLKTREKKRAASHLSQLAGPALVQSTGGPSASMAA